jgi:predicted RNA-binding protein YlqC (UPF0109 family)
LKGIKSVQVENRQSIHGKQELKPDIRDCDSSFNSKGEKLEPLTERLADGESIQSLSRLIEMIVGSFVSHPEEVYVLVEARERTTAFSLHVSPQDRVILLDNRQYLASCVAVILSVAGRNQPGSILLEVSDE